MLHNRFAGEALRKVDRLYEAGIEMNGQIVLCRGINDGEELERSIRDLAGYLPYLQSVSVVPVGLTRYRDGLYPLEPFTPEDARKVLEMVRRWQDELYEKWGSHFIHAGDEWYLLAGEEMPPQERYDGYLQLENGVGMMRLLEDEFREAFEKLPGDEMPREVSVATGKLAYPLICSMAEKLKSRYPGTVIHTYQIENRYFGERITVAGLITGQDLIAQLKDQPLGETLLLPCNMFRSQEEVLLDDMTLDELKDALQSEIDIVKSSGQDFIDAVLKLR